MTMRSLCAGLSAAFFLTTLMCLAPGCDGGGALEEQPDVQKKVTISDMPGFNKMQDQLKEKKK